MMISKLVLLLVTAAVGAGAAAVQEFDLNPLTDFEEEFEVGAIAEALPEEEEEQSTALRGKKGSGGGDGSSEVSPSCHQCDSGAIQHSSY